MIEQIKRKVLKRLKELPNFESLQFVYLYGSQAYGKVSERSDIDICLFYNIDDSEKLHHLLYKISGSFPDKYDLHFFQFLPLHIRNEVFKGEPIFIKDKELVHDLARSNYKEFKEFKPRRDYILYGKAGLGDHRI